MQPQPARFIGKTDSKNMYLAIITSIGCGICLGWLIRGRFFRSPKLLRGSQASEESDVLSESGEYKLVLVVRNDLKMGKGKAAAQCSHATLLAYKQMLKTNKDALKHWERFGQPKVVVKVEDDKSLLEIQKQANGVGLTTSMIRDAGRTQLASGSRTVLGVGPGSKDLLDQVTGHLKLY